MSCVVNRWFWAVLLVVLGAHRGAETLAGQQGAARGFSWKSRYSEALKQACQRQLLLVVYFRPVIAVEPRALFFARKTANLERIVAGVRVEAAEVVELRKRFAVKQFPAVVVLDCRENVLMHWHENIPADLWKRVATMFRSQREERPRRRRYCAPRRSCSTLVSRILRTGNSVPSSDRERPLLASSTRRENWR